MTSINPLKPVPKGMNRVWLQCRDCGAVYKHEFVPYSLSNPIMTTSCGHSLGFKDLNCVEIDANKAIPIYLETYFKRRGANNGLRDLIDAALHCGWQEAQREFGQGGAPVKARDAVIKHHAKLFGTTKKAAHHALFGVFAGESKEKETAK